MQQAARYRVVGALVVLATALVVMSIIAMRPKWVATKPVVIPPVAEPFAEYDPIWGRSPDTSFAPISMDYDPATDLVTIEIRWPNPDTPLLFVNIPCTPSDRLMSKIMIPEFYPVLPDDWNGMVLTIVRPYTHAPIRFTAQREAFGLLPTDPLVVQLVPCDTCKVWLETDSSFGEWPMDLDSALEMRQDSIRSDLGQRQAIPSAPLDPPVEWELVFDNSYPSAFPHYYGERRAFR